MCIGSVVSFFPFEICEITQKCNKTLGWAVQNQVHVLTLNVFDPRIVGHLIMYDVLVNVVYVSLDEWCICLGFQKERPHEKTNNHRSFQFEPSHEKIINLSSHQV